MRVFFVSLLYLVSMLFSIVTVSAELSAGLDHPEVPLPAFVNIVYERTKTGVDHQFLLSTPKRINNTLSIEKSLSLSGNRKNVLLDVKNTATGKNAYRFFTELLLAQGEIFYQCERRACGSSNYWANSIFHESKLYGRDSDQYYVIGKINLKGKVYWLSAYAIKNGRKQQYVFLSLVLDNQLDTKPVSMQLSDWQSGRSFTSNELDSSDIDFLKVTFEQDSSLVLYLLSYAKAGKKETLLNALNNSELAGEKFEMYLINKLGLNADQIVQKNVGPFGGRNIQTDASIWFRLYVLTR